MVDNQAEEEDDESFGDFMCVSYPNQPTYPNQMNGWSFSAVGDDDWSGFMNNTKQINGGLEHETFPSHANKLSQIVLAPGPAESENSRWTRPQGALPLSIFGEEEEDEPAPSSLAFANGADIFFNKNGESMKKGSNSNGALRINDMISNLYNQIPRLNSDNVSNSILSDPDLKASGASSNGNGLISTAAPPPPNPDANGLNPNINNLNSDSVDGYEDIDDDEDGWEFKCAEPEIQIKSNNIETKRETDRQVGSAFRVGFGNGVHLSGNMLDLSNGISHKVDERKGFEFSPLPDHTTMKLGQESKSANTIMGLNLVNENFGEFKDAYSEPRSNHNLEAPKLADIFPTSEEAFKFDGEGTSGPIDQSHAPKEIPLQSDEWGFGFNFNHPSLGGDRGDHHIPESYPKSKQDDNNRNSNTASTNTNVDSDLQLFEYTDTVTEIGIQHEKNQISSENRREALPMSIFGDETPATDDHSVYQDFSSYVPTLSKKNNFSGPGSNLFINDLVWNLYSQAEHKASPNSTPKAMENGIHETPEVLHPNLVNSEDDFNDDSWEFVGASSGTRLDAQKTHSSLQQEVGINGSQPFAAVLNSELTNGDNGFENDSLEFKDASSGTGSQDQASVIDHKNSTKLSSTKLESLGYVDLYYQLKDELCNAILCHLQNLKKAQSIAAVSGEDAKAKTLQEEIQEFSVMLRLDDIIPKEYLSDNHSPRNMCVDQLLELLKEPKFQPLEIECQLTSRLSLAEKDITSTVELLKHVISTLRILELRSREDQSYYLTTWSKIASVCSQELKHGAFIWRESVQKNVHDQILSDPKGIQYFTALGEIYRVAEIVGVSAKLYRPWVLSGSADTTSLFTLLNDCNAAWSGSGLVEALSSIMNQTNSEQDGISRELLESIKYIHEFDEHVLLSYVISGPETCQLSALPADIIPGLKVVTWNGKHCFLTVANLWANLISSDPPT